MYRSPLGSFPRVCYPFVAMQSIKVKNSYLEQLKDLGLAQSHFVPGILSVLNVMGGSKPFSVDMWSVDEFFMSLWDDSLPDRFKVLAAHVYYRSLVTIPSLIRSAVQDYKDRKLIGTIATYTGRSFTPIIVSRELSRLRAPETADDLADENFKIKVFSTTHESAASATYLVDEQPMEIVVKFPSDFPLHNVEVKEVQRLGIPETKWRAWLFNVQQVAHQTGSIVDALSLWKRNIAAHFEGKQECAICYSVINVVDQSLPTKPCKTCNNRFHASCLYKWFNTSHNSTCPLCRSNIL